MQQNCSDVVEESCPLPLPEELLFVNSNPVSVSAFITVKEGNGARF